MKRSVGLGLALCAAVAFCFGGASELRGQAAPPNDSVTNAQSIIGTTGTVYGTNLYVPALTNKPASDPFPAEYSIWYEWTAPISTTMAFDTRNSTTVSGAPLNTVLVVYKQKVPGTNVAFTNLTAVATNDDDMNTAYGVWSRVNFAASIGTSYFIQIDGSQTNNPGTSAQGYTTLNWAPSLVAGGFGFSTSHFQASSLENYLGDASDAASIYHTPQGSPNFRLTVTRTGGYTGKCELSLILTNAVYTNYYYTNIITDMITVSNTSNGMLIGGITNITIITNNYINTFSNVALGGGYQGKQLSDVVVSFTTNYPGFSNTGYAFFPGLLTNFPCSNYNIINKVTNSDTTITWTALSQTCQTFTNQVLIASALPGIHYIPQTIPVTFRDFQMSQDIYVSVDPILGSYPKDVSILDCAVPGPEDYYNLSCSSNITGTNLFNGDPNYIYQGLNASVQLILTNVVLDPSEDQDIVPPTISQPTSTLDILNYYGNPTPNTTNGGNTGAVVINLERVLYRTDRGNKSVSLYIQTYPRCRDAYTFEYSIDQKPVDAYTPNWNTWPTVADADYASPNNGNNVYDFSGPYNGTLTLPSSPPCPIGPTEITIPINDNGAEEFDSDIYVELWQTLSDYQQDSTATIPGFFGNITSAHMTINYGGTAEPGGAGDATWNVDNSTGSQPVGNPTPGATGGVGAAVQAVAIQPADGKAVIGGYFNAYNITNVYGIARLQTNGFLDTTFNTGTGVNDDGSVYAIVVDAQGRVIIGGSFNSYNNNFSVNNIARLNANGSLDTTFKIGTAFNGPVTALCLDASGNILVGGQFSSYNTTNCNNIARLLPSGALDPSFLPDTANGNPNLGTDGQINTIATDTLGNVVIGGQFTHVNGVNLNYLARLLPGGALDTNFSPNLGPDNYVYGLAIETNNNNEIVIGGAFQNYNRVTSGHVALVTYTGGLDGTFAPGAGANDVVYSVVIQSSGNIVIGGQFTSYDSTRRIGLARLLPSGWLDTSFMDTSYNQFAGIVNDLFIDAPNTIYSIGLESSGNMVIGGEFYQIGGGGDRADIHPRANVAHVIGGSTPGPQNSPGIGNCPGNITFTQNPYEALDTQKTALYVTIQRTNGCLGPVSITLASNTLPPGPGAATQNDFALGGSTVAVYHDYWDRIVDDVPAGNYGWKESDGYFGINLNGQEQPGYDGGSSALDLFVSNDLAVDQNLFADLSLLNINSYGLLSLGGVPIPSAPAPGNAASQLEIVENNFPVGYVGYSATNYTTVNSSNQVTVTVVRTNGDAGLASVYYYTADGTARVASGDYTSTFGKLTFNAGTNAATFNVQIGHFDTLQPTKFFNVYFSNALPTNILSPAELPTNATVTIIDGTFAPGALNFTATNYSVLKGGAATVTVQRVGGAKGELQVQVGTANGSATNGLNYIGTTNTLTWLDQDISTKSFTVQTLQDNTVDGPETVKLSLFNATNVGVVGSTNLLITNPSTATITIGEVNSNGVLSFVTPNFNIMENAGQALITVIRTSGTTGTVSVGLTTLNDLTPNTNTIPPFYTAYAGTNYGTVTTNLIFNPGDTSKSVVVPILDTSPNDAPGTGTNRMLLLILTNGSPSSVLPQTNAVAFLNILDPNLVQFPAGTVDQPSLQQSGIGFNNFVLSLGLQPDGSVLAGGDFTFFNHFPFDYVTRLNPNASVDSSFLLDMAGPSGPVNQVISQSTNNSLINPQTNNGPIMIVGGFNQVDGVNRNGVARVNLNGSLDESFDPGSGADNSVFAMAPVLLPTPAGPQATYFYLAGSFVNYNGNHCGGVTRISASTNASSVQGTTDANFNDGQGATGSNAIIRALAVQVNGDVIVGGDFTSFDGVTHNHLARLNVDGSIDPTFNPSTGSDPADSVRAIAVQPDGRILIGGFFTNVNGTNCNYLARLNTDGTLDTNFNLGTNAISGPNNAVLALAVDSQQRILVGGQFTSFSNFYESGILRLNPDGTIDPTINFGAGAEGGFVDAITVQTNDEIDLGGGFSIFEGQSANNFIRLYGGAVIGDGTIDFTVTNYGVLDSATNAVITLQRFGGEGTTAFPTGTITLYTQDGTAQSNVDYVPLVTNITFLEGQTFATVTIPVIPTQLVASNKYFYLYLTNATNVSLGAIIPSATVTITNANSAIVFAQQTYNQSANAQSGEANITLNRIGFTGSDVGITVYTGTNGTATPFLNYTPETNFIEFLPGVTTQSFNVPVTNPPNMFSDVSVDLEMENPSNAFIGSPSSATLIINSVASGVGVLSFQQTNFSVSEFATNVVITVLRTNGSSNTVSVTLTTSNATAVANVNYTPLTATLVFPPGQTVESTNIPIIPLTNGSPNLFFYLILTNATGGAAIAGADPATVTILNEIQYFSFANLPYFVNEGAGTFTVGVSRNGPATNTVSVNYNTLSYPNAAGAINGYAVAGSNYMPTNGTLTFSPNETFATFPVTILQGTNVNPPLSFEVNLTSTTPGVQAVGPVPITIFGDVTGFELASNAYTVAENGTNLVITVLRTNFDTGTASVQFGTSDGTNQNSAVNALNGVDYLMTNGTLTFSNGQASNSIVVTILNQTIVENSKSFNVSLSNAMVTAVGNQPTNAYIISNATALVTITDVFTGIGFSSPTYSASECGGAASITIVRSGPTNTTINAVFSTVTGGTAVPGSNYFSTNVPVTLEAGELSTNVFVEPIANVGVGPNHTVLLALSQPQGGAQLVNPSNAVLTILQCTNGSYIEASGTAFVSGSTPNNGGVIFPGETVTVLLGLRDIAGENTTSLTATLLPGSGVTNTTAADTNVLYGALINNGPTVAKAFTFTAVGTNGQLITPTLRLVDGSNTNINQVLFAFTLGGQTSTFRTNETILLNGTSPAPSKGYNTNPPNYGYPSQITVSGIQGTVAGVTVNLTNFGHTYPSDVEIVLQGPGGQSALLMNNCGGGTQVQHANLTFSQAAASSLPESTAITSGTYLPTTYGYTQALPTNGIGQPPAPTLPYQTNLNNFIGQPANGAWSLFAADTETLDSGYVSNGWSLTISTGLPVEEDADLELTLTSSPSAATVNNPFTYTIAVTNFGPAAATNVVISDTLPAGVSYAGGYLTNGVVTFVIGNLAVSNGVVTNITVMPTNSNILYMTNVASVVSSEPDPNVNYVQTNIAALTLPNADLAASLTGGPNPVMNGYVVTYTNVVYNNGPSSATNVVSTNQFPANFVSVTSAGAPGGTITTTTNTSSHIVKVVWSVPGLAAGATVAMTNTATANLPSNSLPSASLDQLFIGSQTYDSNKFNNYAAIKTEVVALLVAVVGTPTKNNISPVKYSLTWPVGSSALHLQGAVNVTGPWFSISNPAAANGYYSYDLPGTNGYHYFRLMSSP